MANGQNIIKSIGSNESAVALFNKAEQHGKNADNQGLLSSFASAAKFALFATTALAVGAAAIGVAPVALAAVAAVATFGGGAAAMIVQDKSEAASTFSMTQQLNSLEDMRAVAIDAPSESSVRMR